MTPPRRGNAASAGRAEGTEGLPAEKDPRRGNAASLVGLSVAFVVAVELVRLARPGTLLDPDAAWAIPRLLLGLGVAAAAASAGALAGALFAAWSRSRLAADPLAPLPLRRTTLVALAAAAFLAGAAARAAWIATLPIPFLEDEVNLVPQALALAGTPADFSDAIRPIPPGRPDPHEVIGVAYLEILRASLRTAGATILGLRVPTLVAGILSLATAGLLARALLPAGGGALAVLVLAGLRWHAILSLSGFQSIVLVPLCDLAALGIVAARRSGRAAPAAAAGAAMGLGAHFYLAAWPAAAGLAGFAAWPSEKPGSRRAFAARLFAFAAGLALVAAPLFLLREGRRVAYFGRTSRHSVAREIVYQRSALPALGAAADALLAPWFLPDPEGRHDLEGASRLGIVGIPVAVALARALVRPRAELSGYLLATAAAALMAAVAGGAAGHPNGFRFGYLTSATAVAASAGTLALVTLAPPSRRRAASLACAGVLAAAGLVGLRQALVDWPSRRATFDSFHGEDTLIGRAAARWSAFGRVAIRPSLGRSDATIATVARYGLDVVPPPAPAAASNPARSFRIAAPGERPADGERAVERVRDAWGRERALVLGRRSAPGAD